MVEHFCAGSRLRIEEAFRGVRRNNDRMGYRLAQDVLQGSADWLLDGIVGERAEVLESTSGAELAEETRIPELEEVRGRTSGL